MIIESFPNPFIPPSSESRMNMNFTVLPVGYGPNMNIWLPRVICDGTEVLVREGPTVDEQDGSAGKTATFTLVEESQKDIFDSSALIDFGWGERDSAGAWIEATMEWEILDGYLQSRSDNKQGPPNNVQDAITITIGSNRDQKLNTTSEMGLTIYDPNRLDISSLNFKVIPGSDGQEYTREIVAIPGLQMSDLFDRIFITECGFTSYDADQFPLDDWPIERYDCNIGQRFYDALKGHISIPHSMTVSDDGTELRFWDITLAPPEGFPAGRQITVDDISAISLNEQDADLDALKLQYLGLENNYDFTDNEFDYPDESNGETDVYIEDIYLRFFKEMSPGNAVVVNRIPYIRNKRTEINGVEVERVSDNYEFAQNWQYARRRKTTQTRLPNLPTNTPTLMNSSEEIERYTYQAHPFKQKAIYRSTAEIVKSGLVTNDADNPDVYENPAKQAFDVSLRSNNMAEGQTFTWETIYRRSESYIPQRDGTVLRFSRVTDNVVPSQPMDHPDRVAGDVSILTTANGVQEMIVTAVDNDPRTLKRIDDFPVGELLLRYAQPLARRELIRRQTANRSGTVPFIGFDKTLQKGAQLALYDREGAAIGNFIIKGWSRTSDNTNGLIQTLQVQEIAGSPQPLQRQSSYRTQIESASTWTGTLPIDCTDDFYLTIDPGTVANVSIEARHVEVPALGWTNLETTTLDLSPWDGDTEDFEFRIIAGTVTVPTEVSFDLVVTE